MFMLHAKNADFGSTSPICSDGKQCLLPKNAMTAAAESTDTGLCCSDSTKIRGRRVDALHYAQDCSSSAEWHSSNGDWTDCKHSIVDCIA